MVGWREAGQGAGEASAKRAAIASVGRHSLHERFTVKAPGVGLGLLASGRWAGDGPKHPVNVSATVAVT